VLSGAAHVAGEEGVLTGAEKNGFRKRCSNARLQPANRTKRTIMAGVSGSLFAAAR
jgi:hypothetical protein